MKKIEQNLEELADCFVDVQEEVKAQAENLTVVENNTSNAKAETSHGVQELTEANSLASKIRSKQCLIVLIIVVGLVVIGGIIAISICAKGSCKSSTTTVVAPTTTVESSTTSSTTSNTTMKFWIPPKESNSQGYGNIPGQKPRKEIPDESMWDQQNK